MAKDIFAGNDIRFEWLPSTAVQAHTVLHIGGSKTNYVAINLSGGNQNARLQVEASVDGSLYAIGCKGGIGRYQMSFYDGPFTKCTGVNGFNVPSSIARKYVSLQTVHERHASVYIYRGGSSSSKVATFEGLLNNMTTQLVEWGPNLVYLQVTVDLLGSWK